MDITQSYKKKKLYISNTREKNEKLGKKNPFHGRQNHESPFTLLLQNNINNFDMTQKETKKKIHGVSSALN